MKAHYFFAASLIAAGLFSCQQEEKIGMSTEEVTQQLKDQVELFSTAAKINLSINYNTPIKGFIPFEVYDCNPVVDGKKDESIIPVYSSFTSSDGIFNGEVEMPEYITTKDVYVYTSTFYLPKLVKAKVAGNSISAEYTPSSKSRSRASRAGSGTTSALDEGWNKMGEFYGDGSIGYADGLYKEEELAGAYKTFNMHYENLRTNNGKNENEHKDFKFSGGKDNRIAVTFLESNTPYNSSLGYYYYSGSEPDYENLNIYLLYPNAQDGEYDGSDGLTKVVSSGLDKGTTVYLRYYNADGSYSYDFPENTKIGFVLLSNAWSEKNVTDNNQTRACTNATFSLDKDGKEVTSNDNKLRSVIAFTYDEGKGLSGTVKSGVKSFFAFEDNFVPGSKNIDEDKNDYKDVVIMVSTGKKEDIEAPWIEVVDPDTEYTLSMEHSGGLFAFEDLWPAKGDFDMNDVLVRFDYSIRYYSTTMREALTGEPLKLSGEDFVLTPGQNVNAAGNINGFGVCLKTVEGVLKPGENCEVSYLKTKSSVLNSEGSFVDANDYEPFEPAHAVHQESDFNRKGTYNVVLLTNNVKGKSILNHHIKIAVDYINPIELASDEVRDGVSTINPFIYKVSEYDSSKRWEVHLVGRIPTEMADPTYFGTEDDASDPDNGLFYVRKIKEERGEEVDYPFSFYLLGVADQNNFENLRDKLVRDENGHVTARPKNESVEIGKVFPRYNNWIKSDHKEDIDWYID